MKLQVDKCFHFEKVVESAPDGTIRPNMIERDLVIIHRGGVLHEKDLLFCVVRALSLVLGFRIVPFGQAGSETPKEKKISDAYRKRAFVSAFYFLISTCYFR